MSTDATEIAAIPPEPRPGTTDDKLLPHFSEIGAVPDRIVAAKAGVSLNTVRNFRAHHGIPSSRPVSPPKKSTKAKKASKAKAAVAPKEKGRPGRKSKIKPFHDLVGTMPDEELAKMAGAAASTVENYRRKNKIPAFEGEPGAAATPRPPRTTLRKASGKASKAPDAPKGRPGRKSKVAPFSDLMGKVPDEEVAAKAGVQVTAVQAYRRKHGIPAFVVEGAAAKAAAPSAPRPARKAAAPTAKATSTTKWGWRVTFATEKARLVVASNAGEAVEAAAKAGLGEVVQVERLIEALSPHDRFSDYAQAHFSDWESNADSAIRLVQSAPEELRTEEFYRKLWARYPSVRMGREMLIAVEHVWEKLPTNVVVGIAICSPALRKDIVHALDRGPLAVPLPEGVIDEVIASGEVWERALVAEHAELTGDQMRALLNDSSALVAETLNRSKLGAVDWDLSDDVLARLEEAGRAARERNGIRES